MRQKYLSPRITIPSAPAADGSKDIPPLPEGQEVIMPGFYRNKRGQIVYIDVAPPFPNRKLRRTSTARSRHHKNGK